MTDTVIADIDELKSFDSDRFNPEVIYESDEMKVIAAFFKVGQFIPVHSPDVDVVFYVIDGKAEIVTENGKIITDGEDEQTIAVPRGKKRGIKALTDLTALHIVQPVPSEVDHREVKEKLKTDSFI